MALPRVFDLLDHGRSIAPPPTPKQAAQAAADTAAAKASAEDSSVHNNYFLLEKFYTMVRFGRKNINNNDNYNFGNSTNTERYFFILFFANKMQV